MDTSPATLEALREKAISWNLEQWSSECAKLEDNELATLIPLASPEMNDPTWKEKLLQLFLRLPSNSANDLFFKALNTSQIIELIDFAKNNPDTTNRLKLSSLFVSISPAIFKDLLIQSSANEITYLREEAFTEAIQHNLSLFTNELNKEFADFCRRIAITEKEVAEIDLQSLNQNQTTAIYHAFENFHKESKNISDLANKALTLAWSANRPDLIQELGRIKELCQKGLLLAVGHPSENETPASGLYHAFEKKVNTLFSDEDSNGNVNLMDDSTPALEALVKFSVWYIQDYCDIGLLPHIQSRACCRDDDDEEDTSLKKREQLFMTAEKNLADAGLKTLADIKSARIYSKKALIEYLQGR